MRHERTKHRDRKDKYNPAKRGAARSKAKHACVTQASPGQQKQRDLQAEPSRFTTLRVQCNCNRHSTSIKSRYPDINPYVYKTYTQIISGVGYRTGSVIMQHQYMSKKNLKRTNDSWQLNSEGRALLLILFLFTWLIGVGGQIVVERKSVRIVSPSHKRQWERHVDFLTSYNFSWLVQIPPKADRVWVGCWWVIKSVTSGNVFLRPKCHIISKMINISCWWLKSSRSCLFRVYFTGFHGNKFSTFPNKNCFTSKSPSQTNIWKRSEHAMQSKSRIYSDNHQARNIFWQSPRQ